MPEDVYADITGTPPRETREEFQDRIDAERKARRPETFAESVDNFEQLVKRYVEIRGDRSDTKMYDIQFQAGNDEISELLSHLCSLYDKFQDLRSTSEDVANSEDYARFLQIVEENKLDIF